MICYGSHTYVPSCYLQRAWQLVQRIRQQMLLLCATVANIVISCHKARIPRNNYKLL